MFDREEEVFGAVEEVGIGDEAVKREAAEVGEENGQAPWFVAPFDVSLGEVGELGGDTAIGTLIVEEGEAARLGLVEGGGEFGAVAAEAGATVDSGRYVNIVGHILREI